MNKKKCKNVKFNCEIPKDSQP